MTNTEARKMMEGKRAVRFINNQRRLASCGPTAIANLMKWLGYSPNSHDLLYKHCFSFNYKQHHGMVFRSIEKVLRGLNIPYNRRMNCTVKSIEKVLDEGSACILAYRYWHDHKRKEHYAFIHGHTSKRFKICNAHYATYDDRTYYNCQTRSKDAFRKIFDQSKRDCVMYPTIWVFSK